MLIKTLAFAAGSLLLAASAVCAQSAPPGHDQAPLPYREGPAAAGPEHEHGGGDRRGSWRRDRQGSGLAEGIAACRIDLADLCRGGARGGGLQCLAENRDRVSPPCGEVLAAIEGREPRGRRRAEGRGGERDGERDWGRGAPREQYSEQGRDGRGPFGGGYGGGERSDRAGGGRSGPNGSGPNGLGLGRACRADAEALCGTVERGPGRRQCLMEHETQLSPECREALASAPSRRAETVPVPAR